MIHHLRSQKSSQGPKWSWHVSFSSPILQLFWHVSFSSLLLQLMVNSHAFQVTQSQNCQSGAKYSSQALVDKALNQLRVAISINTSQTHCTDWVLQVIQSWFLEHQIASLNLHSALADFRKRSPVGHHISISTLHFSSLQLIKQASVSWLSICFTSAQVGVHAQVGSGSVFLHPHANCPNLARTDYLPKIFWRLFDLFYQMPRITGSAKKFLDALASLAFKLSVRE